MALSQSDDRTRTNCCIISYLKCFWHYRNVQMCTFSKLLQNDFCHFKHLHVKVSHCKKIFLMYFCLVFKLVLNFLKSVYIYLRSKLTEQNQVRFSMRENICQWSKIFFIQVSTYYMTGRFFSCFTHCSRFEDALRLSHCFYLEEEKNSILSL